MFFEEWDQDVGFGFGEIELGVDRDDEVIFCEGHKGLLLTEIEINYQNLISGFLRSISFIN